MERLINSLFYLGVLGVLILASCSDDSSENASSRVNPETQPTPVSSATFDSFGVETTNHNATKFLNGIDIPEAKTAEEWKLANENKKAVFSRTSKGDEILYNYYALIDSNGLVPSDKLLTKKDILDFQIRLKKQVSLDLKGINSEERNYLGKYFDIGVINWWIYEPELFFGEEPKALVAGWNIEGNHLSIQEASPGNGFFIRCKK